MLTGWNQQLVVLASGPACLQVHNTTQL